MTDGVECYRREERRGMDGYRIDDGVGNVDIEGEHELRALEQEVVLAEVDQAVQPEGVDVRGRDEVSAHVEDSGDPGKGAARPDHESLESGNEADRLGSAGNRLFRSDEHTSELHLLMRTTYDVF